MTAPNTSARADAIRRGESSLGVALLGFGLAGRLFHAPFIDATPGLSLRVVATSQRARVHEEYPEATVVDTPEAAIAHDDVDLVVVATPNDTHAPLAEAAMRAGRHVVVDKPFTVTLDEARALEATAGETRRTLAVFQNRRWDSDFLAVQQAIGDGLIGDVVELRSEIARWRPHVRDRWRERPGPGAGLWYDLGPHLVDQALVLFGMPDTVQATLRAQRAGALTTDWFHVVLSYRTRAVILSSSTLAAEPAPRFIARGTMGSFVKRGVDVQEQALNAGARPVGQRAWGHDDDPLLIHRDGEAAGERPVPAGDYGRFYAAVREAIVSGAPAPVTAAEAIRVMSVIEAGLRSSDGQRAVAVDNASART